MRDILDGVKKDFFEVYELFEQVGDEILLLKKHVGKLEKNVKFYQNLLFQILLVFVALGTTLLVTGVFKNLTFASVFLEILVATIGISIGVVYRDEKNKLNIMKDVLNERKIEAQYLFNSLYERYAYIYDLTEEIEKSEELTVDNEDILKLEQELDLYATNLGYSPKVKSLGLINRKDV